MTITNQTTEKKISFTISQEWPSQFTIRHLQQADLPALEWDGEYTHFRRVFNDAYLRAIQGYSVLWVAELEGTGIIGQVFLQLICDRLELADGHKRAYLYSFRIRPPYRGAGLGTRILKIIEDDLFQRGFSILTLNVAKDNLLAQKLYVRNGFKIVAHEPGIWSFPDHTGNWQTVEEPAWRMEKVLR
jgi:ribosomal protein S18 acetylase RimI-like enzyme